MTTWYTADPHFGHANIINLCNRPFATADEMDTELTARWNAVVQPNDTVWVLGDVTLNVKNLGHVQNLTGRKILVAGNHDACWSAHRRWHRAVAKYLDAGFAEVREQGIVSQHRMGASGPLVDLAHLPYADDSHLTDRYADRRPFDYGRPLLCGHVHAAWKTKGRQINVGVDVRGFQPVAEHVLEAEVRGLPNAVEHDRADIREPDRDGHA